MDKWENPDGTSMKNFKGEIVAEYSKSDDRFLERKLYIKVGDKEMTLEELNEMIKSFEGRKIEINFIEE